jgi:HD superfamily phosphodiesterase
MESSLTAEVMQKMVDIFGSDARRINHALKVYGFTRIIARGLEFDSAALDVLAYSAILHDIGIPASEKKYGSSAWNYQEIEGPPIARKILEGLAVSEEIIERVCFIIGHHHSYDRIDGPDFQVIVEADFIVNIYEKEMKNKAIKGIEERIFYTETGKNLLRSMYLNEI